MQKPFVLGQHIAIKFIGISRDHAIDNYIHCESLHSCHLHASMQILMLKTGKLIHCWFHSFYAIRESLFVSALLYVAIHNKINK